MWLRNGRTKNRPWALCAFTHYLFLLLIIEIIKHLLFTGLGFMESLEVMLQNCLSHMNSINKWGSGRIREIQWVLLERIIWLTEEIKWSPEIEFLSCFHYNCAINILSQIKDVVWYYWAFLSKKNNTLQKALDLFCTWKHLLGILGSTP